jgi:uncharacterized protein YbjT (DUF2867 family)
MADAIAGAVRASRVPHVVFLSAVAAVLPDGNGPARDLHHAERALRATGARLSILRAAYLQENVGAALPPALHQGVYPSLLPADLALPTVATRDVGKLAARCLVEPAPRSEIVDVEGPSYTPRQLAQRLGDALGKALAVVEVPAAAHVDVLTQAGLPRPFAEAVAELQACLASGRISRQGDRLAPGTTTVEQVIAELLASAA